MQRRNFIKNTSLAGLGIMSFLGVNGSELESDPIEMLKGERQDFDLKETTIEWLQQKMSAGELTSAEITAWYFKQIETLDKAGPTLNSIIELNKDALVVAATLDAERNAGVVRSMLHGIPILIKDNIDTADSMMTTAGSLALMGNIASKDAHIVKLLRAAGAVLLGKTNLSEFANFRSTRSTSGWSSRGGQTKMPYALNRNTSGSSSGTGAAIAANLCAIGIGTETDGSIVSPASINALVGIKPTVGLWSRSGIIPISATQDTAGPMCRTVKDAAILLGALAGEDNNDPITLHGKAKKDYTRFCTPDGLKGKRLGIEKSFFNGNVEVVALLKEAIEVLKKNGATVVEIDLLKQINPLGGSEYQVLQYEFKDGLNKYLATANASVKSLKEIVAYNKQHAKEAMPYFKQELLEMCDAKGDLNSKEYKEALATSTSSRKIIDDLLQQNNLDAFCGTTSGLSWCIDLVNGDYDTGFSLSSPSAMSGYPHITVPMGTVHHLPIGFSFCGTAYSEGPLIAMAYAFEQASRKREQPGFLPYV